MATLGDLYTVTGRPVLARRQYALIGAIEKLLRANGVRVDLEIALFDVDHGIRLQHALALARIGQRERPSIDGDDVLGWALARNGQCRAALALLEARAPARDAGRAQVLPPRDDRALSRQSGVARDLVRPRARAQPALLAALGAGRAEVSRREAAAASSLPPSRRSRAPVAATAHPLGNFTINRYSELDVSGNRLYVVYVLDMAEIPTFQARQAGGVDAAAYARRIAANAPPHGRRQGRRG